MKKIVISIALFAAALLTAGSVVALQFDEVKNLFEDTDTIHITSDSLSDKEFTIVGTNYGGEEYKRREYKVSSGNNIDLTIHANVDDNKPVMGGPDGPIRNKIVVDSLVKIKSIKSNVEFNISYKKIVNSKDLEFIPSNESFIEYIMPISETFIPVDVLITYYI